MASTVSLPDRTCAKCGGTAEAVSVVRWSTGFVSVSSTENYRCTGCKTEFSVEPTWTLVRNSLGAVVSLALGGILLLDPAAKKGDDAIGWMFVAAAVVTAGYTFMRRAVARKNPVRK